MRQEYSVIAPRTSNLTEGNGVVNGESRNETRNPLFLHKEEEEVFTFIIRTNRKSGTPISLTV
jgi:hypothetical protein